MRSLSWRVSTHTHANPPRDPYETPGFDLQLAKLAGRDLKNVQDDLRLLERYGLVRMSHARSSGKRKVRIPQAVFNGISLKIAI